MGSQYRRRLPNDRTDEWWYVELVDFFRLFHFDSAIAIRMDPNPKFVEEAFSILSYHQNVLTKSLGCFDLQTLQRHLVRQESILYDRVSI